MYHFVSKLEFVFTCCSSCNFTSIKDYYVNSNLFLFQKGYNSFPSYKDKILLSDPLFFQHVTANKIFILFGLTNSSIHVIVVPAFGQLMRNKSSCRTSKSLISLKVLSGVTLRNLTPSYVCIRSSSSDGNTVGKAWNLLVKSVTKGKDQLENKRRQFWFCCHMLSGNGQAHPYLEQWIPALRGL